MELKPKIKVPSLECNRILPEGVLFINNMVIKEPEYGMFFIDVFGDKAFHIMSDINKVGVDALLTYLMMDSNITTPKNTRFCLKLRKLIEEHPDQEKSQSKEVKLESEDHKARDIGSPGVVRPEYEGLPWMLDDPYVQVVLQAPPSLDYVPDPEEPEQEPPLPDFVPEPVYPEFMPLEDQSDPEEDPKEDDEEDPEEDPADYLTDGGDDGDDEDESFDDDKDDNVDIEGDEEEEHPAPADSKAIALPAVDQAPSAEETERFETNEFAATPPPHLAYHITARMSIQDEPPTPFWSEAEIDRLLAIPSPPPSPLSS
ncbi:hypothetical protein Tco_0611829 [Tanacetum coccineum]